MLPLETIIEVRRFHNTEQTVLKTMTIKGLKEMTKQKGYIYRAYQIS